MNLEELVEIVENMALQHDYPGFDIRSLKLGLPGPVVRAPAKVFAQALAHTSPVVKLAALRWFWERTGLARAHSEALLGCLSDPDEWVRLEAIRTLGRSASPGLALKICRLLKDKQPMVREAAAKTLGKLGNKSELVMLALSEATNDSNTAVKWKAQKALKQLGLYSFTDTALI